VSDDDAHTSATEEGCPGFVTALVLRCASGDETALMALMSLLYAPVRARLSGAAVSETEADELVGRAFVHIWRRAAAYDVSNPAGVIAWLLDQASSSLEPALAVS
jgi:DNA-directed RNA polymerase specialized sigma24 family protein